MARLVLVTGATGVLGPSVVAAFVADGWRVRTLSRRPPAPAVLPAGVEVVCGDITDQGMLDTALRDASVVIHMAALLHDTRGAVPDHEYERINVEGASTLVERARAAGVARVVLASTICVYGANRSECLTEHTLPVPDTPYAQTKFKAERIVLRARRADGAPLGSVLRLAAIYGPRIQGNYLRLLTALASGRFFWVGPGLNRRALLYDSDAARAFVLAATQPHAAGMLFNVSDGTSPTMREIVCAMSAALGRRTPWLRVPAGCARAVAAGMEGLGSLVGVNSPIHRGTVDKLLEDVVVDSSLIRRELAFRPSVTLAEGWHAVTRDLREQGKLR